MTAAIEVQDVWKKFKRGDRVDSLRDLVPLLTRALVSKNARAELRPSEFWALRNVSFEVAPGEAVGIIGPNGAGKSTMLRLLTRILLPTSGQIEVRGRIGAMIELAAAFHPDLTGRENIFLQGAILGMRRREVAAQLDAIIEFAGVSEFVDTPVKRYSSGMHARLGFSVAAHLSPDVLIIDEVLSVGDMSFQQKCIDRMIEFKKAGVAIVFVSHNLQAVATLCDRAVHLQSEVCAIGPVGQVLESYITSANRPPASSPSSQVGIVSATLSGFDPRTPPVVTPNTPLELRVSYAASESIQDLTFGFLIHRCTDGLVVYDGNVRGSEVGVSGLSAGQTVTIAFGFRAHLTRGLYHIECHVLHNPTRRFLARLRPAAVMTVDEQRTYAGIADVELSASVVERHLN